MRSLIAGALMALAATPVMPNQNNSPRPFSAADLARLERVSDPQLSPDGGRVAYVLRRTDYAANKGVLDVWLHDLKSGQDRQLTRADGNHSDPRWSADGRWLYFLSTRSGSSQVWRVDFEGGDAKPVTELPLAVNTYALSPDGSRIAVSIDVFPDCVDLACSKKRFDERAADKRSGMHFDKLFIRHWDTWKDGTRSQLFVLSLDADGRAQRPLHVSKGIDGDVPSKPFGDASEYTCSPDGKHIVFTARIAGTTEAWSTNLDLWWVPSDGSAAPKNLTPLNEAVDVGPVFEPVFEPAPYKLCTPEISSGSSERLSCVHAA